MHLDEQLFRAAKRYAAEHHTTLTAVMQDALRSLLSLGAKREAAAPPLRLPTFKGQGLQPGADLDDGAALLDLMEKHDRSGR